jgi:hypothetical protein
VCEEAGLAHIFFSPESQPAERKIEMFKRMSVLLLVLAVFLMVGCSKPPEVEMSAADTAMQAAKTAESETYAPQAYRMALDTLNAAKAAKQEQDSKFALFRKYGKSKEMFVSAKALMEKAGVDAKAEKERMRAELQSMLADVKMVLDSAQVALDKAPVGKGNKADIELIKNDLAGVNAAYTAAEAEFQAEKFMTCKAKLETVRTRAQAIITEIEAAKAKKSGK